MHCTTGTIDDVIIDPQRESPTVRRRRGMLRTADNRRLLIIPQDFAPGLQALADDAEIVDQSSQVDAPEHGRRVRWDDPAGKESWLAATPTLSARDRSFPDLLL